MKTTLFISGLILLFNISYSQCTFKNPLQEGADPQADITIKEAF